MWLSTRCKVVVFAEMPQHALMTYGATACLDYNCESHFELIMPADFCQALHSNLVYNMTLCLTAETSQR
jgi:hypothetical protein